MSKKKGPNNGLNKGTLRGYPSYDLGEDNIKNDDEALNLKETLIDISPYKDKLKETIPNLTPVEREAIDDKKTKPNLPSTIEHDEDGYDSKNGFGRQETKRFFRLPSDPTNAVKGVPISIVTDSEQDALFGYDFEYEIFEGNKDDINEDFPSSNTTKSSQPLIDVAEKNEEIGFADTMLLDIDSLNETDGVIYKSRFLPSGYEESEQNLYNLPEISNENNGSYFDDIDDFLIKILDECGNSKDPKECFIENFILPIFSFSFSIKNEEDRAEFERSLILVQDGVLMDMLESCEHNSDERNLLSTIKIIFSDLIYVLKTKPKHYAHAASILKSMHEKREKLIEQGRGTRVKAIVEEWKKNKNENKGFPIDLPSLTKFDDVLQILKLSYSELMHDFLMDGMDEDIVVSKFKKIFRNTWPENNSDIEIIKFLTDKPSQIRKDYQEEIIKDRARRRLMNEEKIKSLESKGVDVTNVRDLLTGDSTLIVIKNPTPTEAVDSVEDEFDEENNPSRIRKWLKASVAAMIFATGLGIGLSLFSKEKVVDNDVLRVSENSDDYDKEKIDIFNKYIDSLSEKMVVSSLNSITRINLIRDDVNDLINDVDSLDIVDFDTIDDFDFSEHEPPFVKMSQDELDKVAIKVEKGKGLLSYDEKWKRAVKWDEIVAEDKWLESVTDKELAVAFAIYSDVFAKMQGVEHYINVSNKLMLRGSSPLFLPDNADIIISIIDGNFSNNDAEFKKAFDLLTAENSKNLDLENMTAFEAYRNRAYANYEVWRAPLRDKSDFTENTILETTGDGEIIAYINENKKPEDTKNSIQDSKSIDFDFDDIDAEFDDAEFEFAWDNIQDNALMPIVEDLVELEDEKLIPIEIDDEWIEMLDDEDIIIIDEDLEEIDSEGFIAIEIDDEWEDEELIAIDLDDEWADMMDDESWIIDDKYIA